MQLIDFFSEKWQVRREYFSALHKLQKVWRIVFTKVFSLYLILSHQGVFDLD